MITLLAKRLVSAIPLLLFLSFFVYLLVDLMPGDAAANLAGDNASPVDIAALREQLGLDRPLIVRYIEWLGSIFTGDFGTSLYSSQSVAQILTERLPITLSLALVTMGMGLAAYRISSGLREALVMSVAKLLMLPLLAWSLARLLGLSTLDGQTVVLLASVPMGVNSYLISRRFGALEGPVSTAMLVSTLASAGLTPLLIVVLRRLEG